MEFSRTRPIWVDFTKGGLTLDGGRFIILAALGTLRDLFIEGRRLAEGQVTSTADPLDERDACISEVDLDAILGARPSMNSDSANFDIDQAGHVVRRERPYPLARVRLPTRAARRDR